MENTLLFDFAFPSLCNNFYKMFDDWGWRLRVEVWRFLTHDPYLDLILTTFFLEYTL